MNVIHFPVSTEKALRMMESENKLVFQVDDRATKQDIRIAIEKELKAKVVSVNVVRTIRGHKRAYVRFAPETPAIDIATNLGLM
ncbi:MAG: 50S ribosomal protein L23 [Nanoarchaeota archaeon]